MSRKPRDPAWLPVPYEPADIEALQALSRGECPAHLQKRALDWIIRTAAGTYEPAFRSDADGGERETAFALGRAYVGQQIVKLVNLPPQVKEAMREKGGG